MAEIDLQQSSELDLNQQATDSFSKLKVLVQNASLRAAQAVNFELLQLYWEIGREINIQQDLVEDRTDYINRLARAFKIEFPNVSGLSAPNLYRMRAFYNAYKSLNDVHQSPIFKLPWGHNISILNKLKNTEERLWYAIEALQHGWSRSVLEIQIASQLFHRQGKALTNFKTTLGVESAKLIANSLKNPYYLDFLDITKEMKEKDIEDQLVERIQNFLEELGRGFSFVGRQVPITVDGDDYYIDLLFFNIKEDRYYVIELKAGDFKPEFAGKLNFYLSVVDEQIKQDHHAPSIGLIICKNKKSIKVEYALKRVQSPIGVSGFETELAKILPATLNSTIPTVSQIESELEMESHN